MVKWPVPRLMERTPDFLSRLCALFYQLFMPATHLRIARKKGCEAGCAQVVTDDSLEGLRCLQFKMLYFPVE